MSRVGSRRRRIAFRNRTKRVSARFVAGLVAALFAHPLLAQATVRPDAATPLPSACIASLPDSIFKRVPVFASLTMSDAAHTKVPPAVANLLQTIADRVVMALGGSSPLLPPGEPTLTWRELGGELIVVWHRDGRLVSTVVDSTWASEPLGVEGIRLVARSLDAAEQAGEALMIWTDDLPGDSTSFRVNLERPVVDTAGISHPVVASLAVPVFSLKVPQGRPVVGRKGNHTPHYPDYLIEHGVEAHLVMQFVVDTNGRADMSTLRDVWSADRPRLSGTLGGYYRDFVESTRRSIADFRFEPAMIGTCPFRQVVQQPFEFRIAR